MSVHHGMRDEVYTDFMQLNLYRWKHAELHSIKHCVLGVYDLYKICQYLNNMTQSQWTWNITFIHNIQVFFMVYKHLKIRIIVFLLPWNEPFIPADTQVLFHGVRQVALLCFYSSSEHWL